eukprot:5860075-Prymnesium_polylepis.2
MAIGQDASLLSLTCSRAIAIVSLLSRALAFARLRRDRSRKYRRCPVAPCPPVAAMQGSAHLQCAGEAQGGRRFRSSCSPSTQAVALSRSMRSSRTRTAPPVALYETCTAAGRWCESIVFVLRAKNDCGLQRRPDRRLERQLSLRPRTS